MSLTKETNAARVLGRKLLGGNMGHAWEQRVTELEEQGLTRSDAQAVVDAEDAKLLEKCPACGHGEYVNLTPTVAGPIGWSRRCKKCKHAWDIDCGEPYCRDESHTHLGDYLGEG